jgi:hypothetical protein
VVQSIKIIESLIQEIKEDFGRGRGRGGIGPIIWHNCKQPGNLARDYPNPCTTCTYCRALNHTIEDCPQLLENW